MDQDSSKTFPLVEMPYLSPSSVGFTPVFENSSVKFTDSTLPTLHLDQESVPPFSCKNVHRAMRCCAPAAQPSLFSKSLKNSILPTTAARIRC